MIKKVISVVLLALVVIACSSSDGGESKPKDNFDRQTMLVNWADNIIIPVYQDLDSKLSALVEAKNTFTVTADQTNLEALRTAWLNAYKVWQYAEMFNIGKAEGIYYSSYMNIYPASAAEIEANIANGGYDLGLANNQDAVGFPALDYLLYGVAGDDSAILEVYNTNANASGYKTYLSDVIDKMKSLTETVLNDWTSTYRDTFVNSAGNTATSSTNKLTNDFIYYFEKGLRANKFGIPAGIFSGGVLYPEKVEGYYNQDVSKELALVALQASQDVFNGKAYNGTTNGSSFDDYLDYLQTITDGEDLTALINAQMNTARTQIQTVNTNFSSQVENDNTKMTLSYDELQKVVVLLKLDMVQAMNISVDYIDADGD
ncbi:imelysin family protein [Aestuariibaculum suncheonense]|uniref:Imelysin family protein n=1 Tax=Aestuariibaculum suncheonense TaxID=1028745 RepID=A0A8J6QB77_9FLAO|nr:imelysin family protein [Aestuariibaculum suncheonense]MBD0836887.1 imelysin family protein [Aestuariibaculum suncheonense]